MEHKWFWRRAVLRASLAFGGATGGPLRADGRRMDPIMAALVRFARRMPSHPNNIPQLRVQYAEAVASMGLWPDRRVAMTPLAIPGVPPAREYEPPTPPRGTLLFLHGGGFVMGSPAERDGLCRRLAAAAGLRVVSAGYRLAPEHPFPAAHDDAAAALRWVRDRHAAAGTGKLLVGGDSAGANLAAFLARDGGTGDGGGDEGGIDGQVLIYPVVDLVRSPGLYPSLDTFKEGYLLTVDGMEAWAKMLLPPGTDEGEARLSPIKADLSRAAPALIVTAGFDPLRDQGTAYAAALRAAGRPAELMEEAGLVHGFADFAGVVPEARRAVDRLAAAVRAML